MRYKLGFTIPAGTDPSSPHTRGMMLARGIITELELIFPPGPVGLVSVAVVHQEHQIYPTTPGEAFIGSDTHITISDRYPIQTTPPTVQLVGWAPLTAYDHTVEVAFTVQEERRARRAREIRVSVPI